jgi:hypothetical protein
MTAPNDRSNHEGILLFRVIECPVCGEKAHSFRIRRVMICAQWMVSSTTRRLRAQGR